MCIVSIVYAYKVDEISVLSLADIYYRYDLLSDCYRLQILSPARRFFDVSVECNIEVRNKERGDGKIQTGFSARNKRAFKNWFLVDTRCPVVRVPNLN